MKHNHDTNIESYSGSIYIDIKDLPPCYLYAYLIHSFKRTDVQSHFIFEMKRGIKNPAKDDYFGPLLAAIFPVELIN